MKRYIQRKALDWVNGIRAEHGLPPVTRLEAGMVERADDCSLARTIAPGQTFIHGNSAEVLGRSYVLPFWVRRFVKRFDWGEFDSLRTVRPSRRPTVDHLDFEPAAGEVFGTDRVRESLVVS
jgi:hypothetical protein